MAATLHNTSCSECFTIFILWQNEKALIDNVRTNNVFFVRNITQICLHYPCHCKSSFVIASLKLVMILFRVIPDTPHILGFTQAPRNTITFLSCFTISR